jgi:glycerol-3-phosphate cytidylyltransferase
MITGFTMGCFDLFHAGHVNLLRAASGMCDKLIVGVFTDEHILSRKKRAAVIGGNDRLAVVCACRYVALGMTIADADVRFWYENLAFDVLFVGDDWRGWPLPGSTMKREAAPFRVLYLPRTPDISTTEIRERAAR